MVNMAGSIKLFQFVQKCHRIFGIYPKQHSTNLTRTIFLISFAQFMFTTVAYFWFEAKSMFNYGFTFYLFVTTTNAITIYSILICQSENTLEFIENCEEFIENRSQSMAAYNELIEKIELFNKLFSFGIYTSLIIILLAPPYSFVRYYIFDMGENSFYLFFPAWFPFDWKTPFGYLEAWLAQCAGGIVVACIGCHVLNFVFGSGWFFIFIAEDITQDAATFNIATNSTTSNENCTELTKRFRDMVQIYTIAKRCVMEFNQIFKYSLFSIFLWDMLSVSSLLVTVQFELWAGDSNLFEISLLILLLNWMILIMFVVCEPGARMTNQLVEFSDELNRCDWYLLSIGLQRCYIIFLLDTQNPIKVYSYAHITCERETSKKMINTAFSYFMTLRRFRS